MTRALLLLLASGLLAALALGGLAWIVFAGRMVTP